jgi:hypothetical protein
LSKWSAEKEIYTNLKILSLAKCTPLELAHELQVLSVLK